LYAVQREGISEDAQAVYLKACERVLVPVYAQHNINYLSYDVDGVTKERLNAVVLSLEAGLIERGTEVRLLLLGAITGEHVLFLGPPGTAKSELARRLSRLCDGSYYEKLLTRFSVPEELFGPLSMRALEEDQYVRQFKGYLPDSKIAFIDEIFKANSAILNALLSMLNERVFDNGNLRIKVPLTCLVAASNELPESEELDALYDRFLLRKKVDQVSPKGLSNLMSSLNNDDQRTESELLSTRTDDSRATTPIIPAFDKSITSIRSEALHRVHVPSDVVQLLIDVRNFLQNKLEPPIYVSDRRLVKSVNMLKVAAFTNGRLSINPFDCLLLRHCLWQNPREHEPIMKYILEKLSSDDEVPNFDVIGQRIFARCCLVLTGAENDKDLNSDLDIFRKDVIARIQQLTSSLRNVTPVLEQNLWIDPQDASFFASTLIPKLNKTKSYLEELLLEIEVLAIIIESKEPSVCAELLGERWAEFLKTPLKLKKIVCHQRT
jgi:MoxR-like ATPase